MKKTLFIRLFALVFLGLWGGISNTFAGTTDLADAPMASSSSSVVKPNIMFVLDDSGSMQWSYLGDTVYGNGYVNTIGYRSSLCNKLYYNPNVTYTPPLKADGSSYPNSPFAGAYYDGFVSNPVTVDLSTGFMAWRSGNSSPATPAGYNEDCWNIFGSCTSKSSGYSFQKNAQEPAYYFLYKGTKAANLGDNSANDQCKDVAYDTSATAGTANWYKVVVSSASGPGSSDERQNFANWYSYYRTRILLMKSAAGRAFSAIGDNYRVGFSTINYTGTDSTSSKFLKIADFNPTQKSSFYSKLYGVVPGGGTPLRASLAKAGQIYAGKLLTGSDDPVQYSCQQNFTILSTDGYWDSSQETGGYGPNQIDGTTPVGNQDNTLDRPMFDGTKTNLVTTATITISGSGNTTISSVTVNGTTITSGAATRSGGNAYPGSMASALAANVNQAGFSATSSTDGSGNGIVKITAPASLGAITYTPVVNISGGMTASAAAFSSTSTTTGGASNTLADVAAYYYNTDLRTSNCTGALGADVCTNNVPTVGNDTQQQQHMTTFTLGLGVNGTLKYTEDYLTATSGDFFAIKQGTKDWPNPITNPGSERVDDLWHAAVNGHGIYFSAQNPDSLVSGISKALAGVTARTGSAAAAATSNLEPVAGDNFVYVALYRTVKWDGDLQAKTIDPSTGTLSTNPDWTAQPLLDAKISASSDTRTIYTYDGSAINKLKPFIWSSLTSVEQGYFNGVCSGAGQLSQCPSLTSAQQSAASGANMVNYLRGQNGNEDKTGNANPLYRAREHVLGDMINSQPVYVKQPPFSYSDANYSAFKKNTRTTSGDARVYVAVNDGMLHAFSGDTGANGGGVEQWAYIPPTVMPNLYKLADKNYASNHQYYVDGSPTVGDVCPNAPGSTCNATQWKTILVGGLNKGGRGYYALDITDPASPRALWNYTVNDDPDLGYSYGNPIITKRKDGTWVVVFASGYNNVNPGDGKGHLYVLNAYTGVRIEKIDTTAGDTTTPSGLAKINAWIDNTTDNTAKRFYGGDLLGNVWRFDIDDVVPPAGKEALLLAQLGNVGTVGTQPITTKPELTEISSGGSTYAVVSVATGRYLGVSDLSDTSQQSIYSFKDNLTGTGLGKVRTAGVLVQQTLMTNSSGTGRTTSTNAVDWGTNSGWYVDLNPNNESPGERVNVDMQQQLGLLTVAANVPTNNACTLGGYAWLYNFDYKTGQYIQTATDHLAGRLLGQNALVAGLKTIKLTTGKTVTLVTDTGGGINGKDDPTSNPSVGSGAKRVSWRELLD